MNKHLLSLSLGLILAGPSLVRAQATPGPAATPAPAKAPSPNAVTPDERKELNKARSDALKAHPELVTEGKGIDDQKKAWQKKVDDAAAVVDPAVAPILAKMAAAHPAPAPSKPKDKPEAKPAKPKAGAAPATNSAAKPAPPVTN